MHWIAAQKPFKVDFKVKSKSLENQIEFLGSFDYKLRIDYQQG